MSTVVAGLDLYALDLAMFISPAPYYLVYFEEDETVSIVSANAVSVARSGTETGSLCNVRVKGKVYEGKTVTYGECCE